MSIWYANYSSQLDKISQCHTSNLKFWLTTAIIKVKIITVTKDRALCPLFDAQTVCALGALITLTLYFCLNTAQYIHVVEYGKYFIMDARVCWRILWGSVVFMCIRASDAPNSLFLERNYLLMASWIVNKKYTSQQAFLIIYLICILSFIYFSLGRSRWVSHLKSRSEHKKVWALLP